MPKLRHFIDIGPEQKGPTPDILYREVCQDTDLTLELNKKFKIKDLHIEKYVLPTHTLDCPEHEDLAARLLWYSEASQRVVAVNYNDFIADIHDDLTESYQSDTKRRLLNVAEEEHSLMTAMKKAIFRVAFRFSLPPPPPRPTEESKPVISTLIALAQLNPSVIEGEVRNMMHAGYFNDTKIEAVSFLEPTEKLLEKVFKAFKK